jgi:hypothetical protein
VRAARGVPPRQRCLCLSRRTPCGCAVSQSRSFEVREVRKQRDLAAAGIRVVSEEEARLAALQAAALEGGVKGQLQLHGNLLTFNMEDLLVTAITISEYYRDLSYVLVPRWRACVRACLFARRGLRDPRPLQPLPPDR